MTATGTRRLPRAVGDAAKEQRRDAILAAAKRVFARKGFHATTVADVAKAARVSYGVVYWYFDSKDELFHALMDVQERALRRHIDAGLSAVPPGTAGEDVFRAAVRATFDFFESDRRGAKLLFRDAFSLGERFERHLAGIHERFVDDIESVVVDAQRAGHVVDAPPRMVAFSVAALIGQLALRRLSTDDGVAAEDVAGVVVSLLVEGLRPR
jgi:AcrR family transcriptional regulator